MDYLDTLITLATRTTLTTLILTTCLEHLVAKKVVRNANL